MSAPEVDLVEIERRFRKRAALTRMLQAAAGVLLVGPLLIWRGYIVLRSFDRPTERPPAAEVDIASTGVATVRGCGTQVNECFARAYEREYNRPGGGSYRVVIYPDARTPREATMQVVRAALTARLMPDEMPPSR